MSPESTTLADLYTRLNATGRGKHIYPFSYYHEALVEIVSRLSDDLAAIRFRLRLPNTPFNVVKLDSGHRISFLRYEPFEVAFPTLLAAESCDLTRGTIRRINFAGRSNPPILHRKELLLPASQPLVPEAVSLTRRLQGRGAFRDTTTIGTKFGLATAPNRPPLRRIRPSLDMTALTTPIARHRTAQRRTDLSSPIRLLMDLGFLDGKLSLFDYGCGRGDDLRLLNTMNITASGWDPVFLPNGERQPADIVNLGFVLNVIENSQERSETLRSAYALTRKVLIVSVMLGYTAQRAQFIPHNDGIRTQRTHFPKVLHPR